MALKCRKCGAVYPNALESAWGRVRESSGYGADPRCIAVVEDPRTGAGAVCGGRLFDSTDAPTVELHDLDGNVITDAAAPAPEVIA